MAQFWCISPQKRQACESPAEDNSLVSFCHKGCICTPTCTGTLQEQSPRQTWACLSQEGAAAETMKTETPGEDWLVHGGAFSGKRTATQVGPEHGVWIPSTLGSMHHPVLPLAEQRGELLSTPLRGAGAPQRPCWLGQGEDTSGERGSWAQNLDPSQLHPPKGCYLPESPQSQRAARRPLILQALCPCDIDKNSHLLAIIKSKRDAQPCCLSWRG